MTNKSKIRISVISILLFAMLSGMAYAEIPPNATNLVTVVDGGLINYTWSAGSSNVTDSYNISISVSGAARTWDNSSSNTTYEQNVGLDEWLEIWVWAYNSTGDGNLSTGYLYADTQADRSTFGELVDLMNAIPSVLIPVLAIIVIVIVITAFWTVGGLIMTMIASVSDIVLGALKFKKR